jgi:putative MATE family efflux protein
MAAEHERAGTASSAILPRSDSRLGLMGAIWSLAWPAIATFGLESLVGLVDMVMVGRLGAAALAGVGVGTQIFYAVAVVMIAVGTGTVALVARHVGAGERDVAEDALLQSLYAGGALSLAFALPVFFGAHGLVALFGVEAPVVVEGTAYVRYLMFGVPAAALFTIAGSGLRGAGDMRTPLLLGALVNTINIAGNYVLIFGKLGFPAMEVRGAALASSLSYAVGVVLALLMLLRRRSVLRLRRGRLRIAPNMARRVLSIGSPTAAEQLLMQLGFMLYLSIAALYGTTAVAAYFIGVRILALAFLPGFGFSAAASTIVGQNLGANLPEEAERSGWEANRLAMAFLSIGGVVIFLGARGIARVFINDEGVIGDAVSFIRILALAQPLMAADFTLGGALRGAGDTRFPLLTVLVGFYGARLGVALLAATVFDLGLTWVWLALLGDYIARAALKAWRFRGGTWKRIRV